LGGTSDHFVTGLTVDAQGNPLLVGITGSDFPFTNPLNPAASVQQGVGFIAKLSSDGSRLIFATGLGGSNGASFQGVALDTAGAIYVVGSTASPDFPTTTGAFQTSLPTAVCTRNLKVNTVSYGFVTKFSPDGKSVVYSTLLAGSCASFADGIAVNAAGEAYVVGGTTSPDFPVTPNSYQPAFPGLLAATPPGAFQAGFALRLSAGGDKLLAGTFLGGGGYSTNGAVVVLDPAGNPYITGPTQGFATKATPGVFQPNFADHCYPVLSITPTPSPYTGTSDGFVLKLDPTLSTAGFLTYFGGSCDDTPLSLALDPGGNIWLAGYSSSPDLPLKDPYQAGGILPYSDPGFAAEFSPDASQLLFSSFTDGPYLALNPSEVVIAGISGSLVSIAKLDPLSTPPVHIDSVGPVVNFPQSGFVMPHATGLAPGLLVQITGRNLGPATKVNGQLDAFNRLLFGVAGTTVLFDGIPAPIISVQASSIICFVPFEVGATTQITAVANGQKSNTVRIGSSAVYPQILSVLNQDGSVNSATNPVKFGSVIVLYMSGLGQTTPLSADGLVNTFPLSVPNFVVSPYVTGDQSSRTPLAVVSAPGLVAGITQVNVALPTTPPAGFGTSFTNLSISVADATAPVYVTQ
jgi:uncharacterized protein (TIGR03437 family)